MSEKNEQGEPAKAAARPQTDEEIKRLGQEALSALKARMLAKQERVDRAFACVERDDLPGLQSELADWPTWEEDAKRRQEADEVFNLLMAAIPNHPACADWLIGQATSGESPRAQDQDQQPLRRALLVDEGSPMAARSVEWFARLIPKSCLIAQDFSGRTTMTVAAAHKNPGFVQALLDAGDNPDEKDARGSWAIFSASVNGATRTLLALIQGGASLDTLDDDGRDALMRAAYQGTTKSVELLAEHFDLSRTCDGASSGIKGARGAVSALEIALEKVRDDFGGAQNSSRWPAVDAIGARIEALGTASRRQKETLRTAWAMGGAERLPRMAAGREARLLAKTAGLPTAKKSLAKAQAAESETGSQASESKKQSEQSKKSASTPAAAGARAKPRRM